MLAMVAIAFGVSTCVQGNIPNPERKEIEPTRDVPKISFADDLERIPLTVDLKTLDLPQETKKAVAWLENDSVEVEAQQLRTNNKKLIYFVNKIRLRSNGVITHSALIICRMDVDVVLKEASASGHLTPKIETVLVVAEQAQGEKIRVSTFLKQSHEKELRTHFPGLIEALIDNLPQEKVSGL